MKEGNNHWRAVVQKVSDMNSRKNHNVQGRKELYEAGGSAPGYPWF
jgi:hypothetical protein